MKIIENEKINENYFFTKHKSGLPIYVYPKKGYNSAYAIFGTHYGSINTAFDANNKKIEVPDGIAHYLEHKLFESEDGDAFSRFAKTGASANAFTSFDQTCYLFSCTENFEQSLEILLDFVQSPFFTDESVQKEQGIIGQEIEMYNDDPNWKVMFNLLGALYNNHPVKTDIAGTINSIAKITPKSLYDCYNSYYNLHNMVLCVVGNVTNEQVINIADKVLNEKKPVAVKEYFPDEPENINKSRVEQKSPIASPIFELGFKEKVTSNRVSLLEVVCTDILLELFASRSSKMYNELLELNLINTASFGYEYFEGPGFASILFSGESKDPDKTAEIIRKYADKIHEIQIDNNDFENAKKAVYGKIVSSFDNIESIAVSIVNGHFSGINLFDYVNTILTVTINDLNLMLDKKLLSKNSSLSIVTPVSESECDV